MKSTTKSVLFVCTGNICRSPTADAILRRLAARADIDLHIDSCGTHGYHVGELPDDRAIGIAAENGIDMASLRARKLTQNDFKNFDYLFAMDNGHFATMQNLCPPEYAHKLQLFLDSLDGHEGTDTPDPYYGSIKDFEDVFTLIYRGCEAILADITG